LTFTIRSPDGESRRRDAPEEVVADIFISYAREDRVTASRLADRFGDEGWTVFWDRDLIAGDNWVQRIEAEATGARCMVALWSAASVESTEVRKETTIGLQRHVLVPAFLEPVDPPSDFREIHASDLRGWEGGADTPGLADLIHAIASLIGRPQKTVTITPVDFVIVVGWPKFWPELGPAVNLTCRFDNAMGRPVTIEYLEMSTAGPHSYYFVWKLLYDTPVETEHEWRRTKTLEIPEGGFRTGVQFRATDLDNDITWPVGTYKCQVLGWADRQREGQAPNLRTDFEVSVSPFTVGQVNELLTATDATWAAWSAAGQASNNARGARASIGSVRVGLPTARAR
jgi:hypothetical protein